MKNYKKIVAGILLVSMVCGSAVACSKKDSDETTTEVKETKAEKLAYGEIAADDFAAAVENAGGTVTREDKNVYGSFDGDVVVKLTRFDNGDKASEYFVAIYDGITASKENGELDGSYSMSKSSRAGNIVLSCSIADVYNYGVFSFAGKTCVEIYTNSDDEASKAIVDSIAESIELNGPASVFNIK